MSTFTKPLSNERFEEILDNRLEKIKTVLGEKAREYVRNGDRLHNFNRAAKIARSERETVLWNGFALKHLVSVLDIIDDIEKGDIPSNELADEKIGDLINYLILLETSIKHRND